MGNCGSVSPLGPRLSSGRHLGEHLTKRQIQLVRQTWAIVESDDLQGTGMVVFKRLFDLEKGLKKLFFHMSNEEPKENIEIELDSELLQRHVIIVMQTLGAAVASLDDSRYLNNVLSNLGEIHANYKVNPDMIPKMWPAVDHALDEKLGTMYTPETRDAWSAVFSYIALRMGQGILLAAETKDRIEASDHDSNETSRNGVSHEDKRKGNGCPR